MSKTVEKIKKYSFLFDILKKHCKNKKCHENYKKIISYLDDETLQFIAECIRNVLSPNNISCFPKAKRNKLIKKISPHKHEIKEVIKKKISKQKRRKYIQNGGGWFLPLLSAIIPLITSFITRE